MNAPNLLGILVPAFLAAIIALVPQVRACGGAPEGSVYATTSFVQKFQQRLSFHSGQMGIDGEWAFETSSGHDYAAWEAFMDDGPYAGTFLISLNLKAAKAQFGVEEVPSTPFAEGWNCGMADYLAFHEMMHACCNDSGVESAFNPSHGYIDMEWCHQACSKIGELKPDEGQTWEGDPGKWGEALALCKRYDVLRDRWNDSSYEAKKALCNFMSGENPPSCDPPFLCPTAGYQAGQEGRPEDCEDGPALEDWKPIPACGCCEGIPPQ
jgi:hypothetical protein